MWRRLAQWGATVLVTVFIFNRLGVSVDEIRSLEPRWWHPAPGPLALASVVLAGAYVLSGSLWVGMVRELGGSRLPLRVGVGIYLMANLGRYVPGKVWQILGLSLLAARAGVPPAVATSAAVLGQALSLAGAALIGSLALFGASGPTGRLAPWVLGAVVVGILLTLSGSLMHKALTLWAKLLRAQDVPSVPQATFGVRWALAYAINWMAYGLAFVVFVRAFGVTAPVLTVASAFVAAYVLGYLALFAPAGLGVREGFLVAFLGPWLAAGALPVAALSRLWLTVIEVVAALVLGGTRLRGADAGQGGP